jgi:hypothetical protein
MAPEYFAGVDLGQSVDHTAIVILERRKILGEQNTALEYPVLRTELHAVYIQRLSLGLPYPVIVRHVADLLTRPPLRGCVSLALDYTGCGRPVADMFTESELSCPTTLVSIHGGDKVTWDANVARIPKRDLVAAANIAMQNRLLKIPPALPHADLLIAELRNFQTKIDPVTAHDSYSAWRDNQHDDLLLALAMACWLAADSQPVGFIKLLI